jgi:hypothetical protein
MAASCSRARRRAWVLKARAAVNRVVSYNQPVSTVRSLNRAALRARMMKTACATSWASAGLPMKRNATEYTRSIRRRTISAKAASEPSRANSRTKSMSGASGIY